MNAVVDTNTEPMLLREDANGVATLTLNRPGQFNSLSRSMLEVLLAELESIAADKSVRAVVLAGAGKAFCAGHDLKEMRGNHTKAFMQALFRLCGKVMMQIVNMPQPVIARIHGIATAAGCQLVSMCDLAVASDVARFAVSGINVGLFCATPSVGLSRNMGRKQAFEMLVTGDFIDAAEAQRAGWSIALCRWMRWTTKWRSLPRRSAPSRRPPLRWASRCSTRSSKWASTPPTSTLPKSWPAT